VILAKTVKGYGMGEAGEGQNITHQQKKMGTASIRAFRDRFSVPIPDDQLEDVPFYKPAEDSPEMKYLRERIAAMGGSLPSRKRKSRAAGSAGAVGVRGAAEKQRGPRILNDDGFCADSQHHHPRQENR